MTAGVPQGSILGPFLWNLVYDRLLERLDNMPMVRATAFADDLAITCSIVKNEEASAKVAKDRQRFVHECRSHTGVRKDGSHAHH